MHKHTLPAVWLFAERHNSAVGKSQMKNFFLSNWEKMNKLVSIPLCIMVFSFNGSEYQVGARLYGQ